MFVTLIDRLQLQLYSNKPGTVDAGAGAMRLAGDNVFFFEQVIYTTEQLYPFLDVIVSSKIDDGIGISLAETGIRISQSVGFGADIVGTGKSFIDEARGQ